jgi:hypothetical protein
MLMTSQSVADDDQVWIARFQRWGLRGMAPILLDVLRPLGFVGGQVITLLSPLLTTFVDAAQLDQLVTLLEDPARLERLRQTLIHEAEQR